MAEPEIPPHSARLAPNLHNVGVGSGVMDAHYFRRSPGAAADGPVAEREVAGRLFIHCANPPKEIRTEKLTERTTLHLPNPTHAWFLENGASFQGPIDARLASDPE